jgi:hypothetical protein
MYWLPLFLLPSLCGRCFQRPAIGGEVRASLNKGNKQDKKDKGNKSARESARTTTCPPRARVTLWAGSMVVKKTT